MEFFATSFSGKETRKNITVGFLSGEGRDDVNLIATNELSNVQFNALIRASYRISTLFKFD